MIDRWLHFIGILLLVEAAVGMLPNLRQTERSPIPQLAESVLAGAAGGAAFLASRRRSSPQVLRAFLWISFIALGGLKISGLVAYGMFEHRWNAFMLFGNASWSLIGFGAPVLWGSALERRETPGSLDAQKAGRISAGVVQLGFVFLFASELQTWGMMSSMGRDSALYGLSQALQLADRVLLLWASIESIRSATDEEVIRRRAAKVHRLLSWWIVVSVFATIGSNVLLRLQWTAISTSSSEIQAYLLRILAYNTITVAAAFAVALHFQSKRGGYKSEPTANPLPGAEA